MSQFFSAREIKLNSRGISRPSFNLGPAAMGRPPAPSLLLKQEIPCCRLCSDSLVKSKSNKKNL